MRHASPRRTAAALAASAIAATCQLAPTGTTLAQVCDQAQNLLIPASGTLFGQSVAAEGDLLVVGDPDRGPEGSVLIFRRTPAGAYDLETEFRAPNDNFSSGDLGDSVDISGNIVVAGNDRADANTSGGGNLQGQVLVYRQLSNGQWIIDQIISPVVSSDFFGQFVRVSGDTLVARGGQTGLSIYRLTPGGEWILEKRFPPSQFFARSFDIEGETLVVGVDDGTTEEAIVLSRQEGVWVETQRVENPTGGDTAFGDSLALDAGRLAIAARGDDQTGTNLGRLYIYSLANDQWSLTAELETFAPQEVFLGLNIAVSGDLVAASTNSSTLVYRQTGPTSFEPAARLLRSSGGQAIAIANDEVFVGRGSDSFVYQFPITPFDPADCNNDGQPDLCQLLADPTLDCNANLVLDECDVLSLEFDCDQNGLVDSCEIADNPSLDCDANGILDSCDIDADPSLDCDNNGKIDACEVMDTTFDCDANGVLDECQVLMPGEDCDANGLIDACEIAAKPLLDCDANGVIDACQTLTTEDDCNQDGVLDACQIAFDPSLDCDADGRLDLCQITEDPSLDCDGNLALDTCGVIDDPGLDCDADGQLDSCQLAIDPGLDCDGDGIFDSCQILADPALDCTGTGRLDSCDIADGLFIDCNADNIPDLCQPPLASGIQDCNLNGFPDDCEITQGFANDCDLNGVPDICDLYNPVLEVVFLVDTSNSNADEVQLICETIQGVTSDLSLSAVAFNSQVLGVFETINPAFDVCVPQFTADVLGNEVQNFAPCCRFITSEEDWGAATAQIAQEFDWQTEALRVVIVFADEAPSAGDPCEDPGNDRDATTAMINIAKDNSVRVLPVLTTGFDACTESLAIEAAIETGGDLFDSDTAGPPLRDQIVDFLIDLATATDVNFNEIPDECDIEAGSEADCNNNEIPDTFEINEMLAADCDGDELLDECQFPLIEIDSGELSPLAAGTDYDIVIPSAPEARGDVMIELRASGDLDAFTEAVTVFLNGVPIFTTFINGANDCPFTADRVSEVIFEEEFNLLITGNDATITLSPTALVDGNACENSFVQAIVRYRPVVEGDCNGNGQPDICELEQFGGDLPDNNNNLIPDECEVADVACPADVNGDGAATPADFTAWLAIFNDIPGSTPEELARADVNRDGFVTPADFTTWLSAFQDGCEG